MQQMNKAIVTSLLAISASAFLCLTSATNTACFNANGEITQVFCEGVDITNLLPNRANVKKCDCTHLKVCSNITIRAKGVKDGGQSRSGVGLCQTANPTRYRDWVCTKSVHNPGWKSQNIDFRRWKPKEKSKTRKRCHKVKQQPCHQSMFWNEGIDAPSVDCVLQQCAEDCRSCAQTGPGNCDPGMCYDELGTSPITGETRCNHYCRVDWKAWGWRDTPTTTGDGYIRLVDVRSGSEDKFEANQPGYYLALVDMNECTFVYKNYSLFLAGGYETQGLPYSQDSQLSLWFHDATMKYVLAVDLAVGGVSFMAKIEKYPEQAFAPSPASSAYVLGMGEVVDLIKYNRNCSISAYFAGFNHAPLIMDPFITINKPGVSVYPSSDC